MMIDATSKLAVVKMIVNQVLADISKERVRQDEKWGQQDHPDGTSRAQAALTLGHTADWFKARYEQKTEETGVQWTDILAEEVAEAFEERDPERLRAELIQVAAVAVAWVEAIDRRRSASRPLEVG